MVCLKLKRFSKMIGLVLMVITWDIGLAFGSSKQIFRKVTRATLRPNICENTGIESFAVETTQSQRLVVLHNPKNKMLSVVNCKFGESQKYVCQTLYLGTTQNYCTIEAVKRFQRLKAAGIIRTARSVHSLTDVGRSIISSLPKVNGLRVNLKNLTSLKTIKSCPDLTTLLRIAGGETWQSEVENLSPEHSALLFGSEVGMSLPVVGSISSTIVQVMSDRQRNHSLLSSSIINVRNKRALNDFKEAIITADIPDSPTGGYTVSRNPSSANNICVAMMENTNSTNSIPVNETRRRTWLQRIFGVQ